MYIQCFSLAKYLPAKMSPSSLISSPQGSDLASLYSELDVPQRQRASAWLGSRKTSCITLFLLSFGIFLMGGKKERKARTQHYKRIGSMIAIDYVQCQSRVCLEDTAAGECE